MPYSLCLLVLLNLIFSVSYALTTTIACPTVSEIKRGEFNDWLPLYQENEELASDADVNVFKKFVTTFQSAKWSRHYLENGHCFYQGDNPMMDKIIFATDTPRPDNTSQWQWTQPSILAECYSDEVLLCPFIH